MLTQSDHQAAGHDGCLADGAIFAKPTAQQEIDFYEAVREAQLPLADWMPIYMGTLKEGETPTDSTKPYIVLQNLYHGFVKPCILDIKLGAVLTDEKATPEKTERLKKVSESTTSSSHGFRVCGMKVYRDEVPRLLYPEMSEHIEVINNSIQFSKLYGRSLTKYTVTLGINIFFESAPNPQKLIERFHQRLQLLYNTLLDSEVRIFSGSLLFIYEADESRWKDDYDNADPIYAEYPDSDSDGETSPAPLSSLHLIDFAHATLTPGKGPDDNVLDGVESLIKIFEELCEGK